MEWLTTGTRLLGSQGLIDPSAVGLQPLTPSEIIPQSLVGLDAVLETLQVRLKFDGRLGRKAVDHPGLVPRALNHPPHTGNGRRYNQNDLEI